MISHGCQSTYSSIALVRIFQRMRRYIRHVFRRYEKWKEMRRQHDELMRMDDRMLKDIGLSRADAFRMTQGHNFWKYLFLPEAYDHAYRPGPERKGESKG